NTHIISETGNVETTKGWDLDGDGVLEIVPNCPNGPLAVWKLNTDANGKGMAGFTRHEISSALQGHGLGAGDITGNGRMDLIVGTGWYEAPKKPWEQEWVFHPEFDLGQTGIPIIVTDVNGDGLPDLIVGGGHRYGLEWYEQRVEKEKRRWIRHPIDPYNSQYHDMMWIDIDGDGEPELVTGKRYRAHCGNDPGAKDPVGIYYFKWNGESFSKQIIDFGPARIGTGLGIYFDMADLTGNGCPDLLAPGKDGLYVFYNEGPIDQPSEH
ncbi:MAG: VCBS repeat-containing protein, partial [Spirochaetales bacterium]|nr:VCBS repeat-containing protein [Spirochaetales bacterium]